MWAFITLCAICRNEMKVCKKLKYKKIIIYMLGIRVNPLALILIQEFLNTYLYMNQCFNL